MQLDQSYDTIGSGRECQCDSVMLDTTGHSWRRGHKDKRPVRFYRGVKDTILLIQCLMIAVTF